VRKSRLPRKREDILRVVIELLESEGYDGLKVKDVAERARTSLATVYKLFPTREELILAALSAWSEENVYAHLVDPVPETLPEWLIWLSRTLFEPFEGRPQILRAYHRARLGPGGSALDMQGFQAVRPLGERYFEALDPLHAQDLASILDHVHRGVMTRLATGEISIGEALDVFERAVVRLTRDDPARDPAREGPTLAASRPVGGRKERRSSRDR